MGEFRLYTYSNTGTEIEFLQGLINLVCSMDEDITCVDENGDPTTAAAQFDDMTSAKTAKIYFKFGNIMTAYFMQRGGTNNNKTNYYLVNNGGHAVVFNNNYWATDVVTRSFTVFYYKSENLIMFGLGDHNATIAGIKHTFIIVKNNNEKFIGFIDSPNTAFLGNNMQFAGKNSSIYTPNSALLSYSAGAGNIDFFDKFPFMSGGNRIFFTSEILPCSTVALFSSISLSNGKNYLAIATNAMIDITPEPEEEEQEATTEGQWDSVPSMQ